MKSNTRRLVRLALLTALILLMSYTPIGYLKIGIIEISFLMLPIIIGGMILGPAAGAFLGLVFGITSFLQCLGTSTFGEMLFSINPFFCFIVCIPTRVLAGWLSGLIFKATVKDGKNIGSFIAASLSGALFNTIFFVAALLLCFGNTDYIQSFGANVWGIIWAVVGVNGLVEAAACGVLGTVIGKVLHRFLPATKSAKA